MDKYKLTVEVEVFAGDPEEGLHRAQDRAIEVVEKFKRTPSFALRELLSELPTGGVTGGPGTIERVLTLDATDPAVSKEFWKGLFRFEKVE